MPVFRMACVDAFSIGLNFPVTIIIEKNRLYLNKVVSRCNYSHVPVVMCLAAGGGNKNSFILQHPNRDFNSCATSF